MNNNKLRHGDVVLEYMGQAAPQLDALPEHPTQTLAEGERTGHAHRVRGEAKVWRDPANAAGYLCVLADEGVTLTHEEHATLALAPGWWRFTIKRQYDEDSEGWSAVED